MLDKYPYQSDESSTQSQLRASENSVISDRQLKDITNLPHRASAVSFAYQSSERDGIETAQFTRHCSEKMKNFDPGFLFLANQNKELQQSLLIEQGQTSELQHFCRQLMQEIEHLKSKPDVEIRIQGYQQQIHEMKEQIKQLTSFHDDFDSDQLKICMERKDQEIFTLKRSMMGMEAECCKYKTEIEALLSTIDSLKLKCDSQSQELITQRQSYQLIADENRLAGKRLGDMDYRVNLVLSENEKLNKLLSDRISQVERLKLFIDNHEEEYHHNLQQLQQKYDNLFLEKMSTYTREKQSIEQNHSMVIQYNKHEFQRQIQVLTTQNASLQVSLNDLRRQLELKTDESQVERNKIANENQQLQQALDALKLNKTELETQADTFRQRTNNLQLEVENLQSELDALRRKEMQLSTIQNQQLQRKEQDDEKQKFIQVNQEMHHEIETLVTQLDEKNELITYLEDNLQEIQVEIQESKQERDQLRQQNNTIKQQLQANQQKMAEFVVATERQHQKLMTVIQELQKRVMNQESRADSIQQVPKSPTFVKEQNSFPSNKKTQGHTSLQRLKQYQLSPFQPKTYTEQFHKQLEYRQHQNDSFIANRSVSCLELVRRQLTNSRDEENQQFDSEY